MPRNHDRRLTPKHLRRAPKGTTIARFPSGRHTETSYQHFAALQAQLRVNDAETLRQALARAVHVEPLVAAVLRSVAPTLSRGWHLKACWESPGGCLPECSAVRLALQELSKLP